MAMASKDSLKRMVMQFRVSELQALLGYAGEPIKHGRKKRDLQKKALNLISTKKVASLHNKIFHLYQNLVQKDQSSDDLNDSPYYPNYKEKYRDLSKHLLGNWPKCTNDLFTNGQNNSGFCNDIYDSSDSVECSSTRLKAFKTRYKNYDANKLNFLKFKKLPFFEYQKEILAVTALFPKKQDDDVFECAAVFNLDSESMSLLESSYQIQIRMCTLGETTEVSDSLPLSLSVKVNDKYSALPPPIPSTNRQGMLLRRMNVPINITSEVHRRSAVNKLLISWSIEDEELYAFTVHLVKKFTSDELINKLIHKGERDPAITKKAIYDNLNDEDNEIAATSLKMSLICPLGKILISLPVRASTCNHLQCFDGTLYIKMNDVKSTWQCPVCNLTCLYENLFIDGYFSDVLKSEAFVANVTEIELDADGNWTPVLPKKRKLSDASSPPLNKKQTLEPVSLPAINAVNSEIASQSKKPEIDLVSDGDSNDLANDLQDFYHQYNRDTELCSYRSAYPILPTFNEMSNHFLDVKNTESNVQADVPIVPLETATKSTKKNVTLVDLTETDSDSDDIRSLSEGSSWKSFSPVVSPTPTAAQNNSSPPCYDLSDSDSDLVF